MTAYIRRTVGFFTRRSVLLALATLAISCFGGATAAHAQGGSVVRSGSYELGGFLGSSYGIDKARWMGGANLTYAVTKYILPYTEFSYFPGIGRQSTSSGNGRTIKTTYSIPLTDFHGGVHIRMPIREFPIVPYGVFGVGMIHTPSKTVKASVDDGQAVRERDLSAPSATNLAVNFGGGLRFYVRQRFGFRAEAKVYKPTGDFKDYFGKVEFGVFYQFK